MYYVILCKYYVISKLQNEVNFQCNQLFFNSTSYRVQAYITFLFQDALFITLGELLKFAATLIAITREYVWFFKH